MKREALILAGGLGTRLRDVIGEIPKPMAMIGGKPFLEYLLLFLSRHQFTHVVLSVGYRYELIHDHFGHRYRDISLSYAVEQDPLGTGGGIRLALEQCHESKPFIFNGDSLFLFDVDVFESFHHTHNCPVSLALKKIEDCSRYGIVQMEGSKITGFADRGENIQGFINAGVYLVHRDLFRLEKQPLRFSFESDFLAPMAAKGQLAGMALSGYFIDIGIPGDYERAQADLPRLME